MEGRTDGSPNSLYYEKPCARTVVSVDLGHTKDPTAIAVLEEREVATEFDRVRFGPVWEKWISVRFLERLPLKTNYVDVVDRIKEVTDGVTDPRPRTVVVDATGVGLPVVHLLKKAGPRTMVTPVILTGGDVPSRDMDLWRVPKRDVIINLQILLEQHRLKFPGGIPESAMLIREMREMRVKVSAFGREQTGCWRDGEHDDLVLAVGLGTWWLGRAG